MLMGKCLNGEQKLKILRVAPSVNFIREKRIYPRDIDTWRIDPVGGFPDPGADL